MGGERDDQLEQPQGVQGVLSEDVHLTEGILSSVPAGVVHVGLDGAIKLANREALRILGMRFDEISRRYIRDWEPETIREDGSPCPPEIYPVSKALTTGEPQQPMTLGVRRPDGRVAWAIFSAMPVKDDAGRVTGAVVSFLDITERKRIEDALRASEAKLKSVVQSAPDIIILSDREHRIQFMSRTIEGFDLEQVIGAGYFDYIRPEDRERVRACVRRVLEEGEVVSWEIRGVEPSDPNWWSTRAAPVEQDGRIVGMTTIATNITERVLAQREYERLQAQLAEAQRMEAVGRLAGGVAHDFNNLLTVIQGNVDLLMRRLQETSHVAQLEQISSAADRAATLTRQLLAFGRQQRLDVRRLDLNEVIAGVEEMLRRLIKEDVVLSLELDGALGGVRADPVQLERVLLNLATNARDAMPDGGRLTIRTSNAEVIDDSLVPAGPYVVLEVIDTGQGIDEETRDRIFEPFFTTKGGGTGLGLASVHGIVSQSGGHIRVDSSMGRGTTFRISFPRADVGPSVQPHAAAAAADDIASGTILLVEDNELVRNVTMRILRQAGYRIWPASGAADALTRYAEELSSVDLLVSDVVMPEVSGPKLAEALLEKKPNLRVLFVSGHADDEIRVRGLDPREVSFLAKPYSADALKQRVREILRG